MNIAVINNLKKLFQKILLAIQTTQKVSMFHVYSYGGAKIIEKHFMINKRDNVVDKAYLLIVKILKKWFQK